MKVTVVLEKKFESTESGLFASFSTNLVLSLTILDVSIVRAFDIHFNWFFWAFPYLIYPTTNIVLTASIFLVVVIAYERYVAVCNPYDYRHTFVETHAKNLG